MGDRPAPHGLRDRWSALGNESRVALDSVGLWTVDLPFKAPVRTARGAHRTRPLVLVHLAGRRLDAAGRPVAEVQGWGECAALADATFDVEDAAHALDVLRHLMVPALVAMAAAPPPDAPHARTGRLAHPVSSDPAAHDMALLPPPAGLGPIREASPHAPLAFAALEMAVADAHLRSEQRSLADLLGVPGRSVEVGAVVGQEDSVDALLEAVGGLVDQGYRRVKLKIGPQWDVEPVARVVSAFPDLLVQVDANGSYGANEEAWPAAHRDRSGVSVQASAAGRRDLAGLLELDRFGLLCIEQPFARDDLAAHTLLAARMTTPICLDESVDSPRSVHDALAAGACSVVCVKPARLGGIGAALDVVDRCARSGVPLWMGGMFESGYARGVLTTLGALDGMAWPGDLAPARSYLGEDLVPDVPPHQDPRTGALVTALPAGTGMGPPPDPAHLVRLGAIHQVIDGPGS